MYEKRTSLFSNLSRVWRKRNTSLFEIHRPPGGEYLTVRLSPFTDRVSLPAASLGGTSNLFREALRNSELISAAEEGRINNKAGEDGADAAEAFSGGVL